MFAIKHSCNFSKLFAIRSSIYTVHETIKAENYIVSVCFNLISLISCTHIQRVHYSFSKLGCSILSQPPAKHKFNIIIFSGSWILSQQKYCCLDNFKHTIHHIQKTIRTSSCALRECSLMNATAEIVNTILHDRNLDINRYQI